MKQVFFICFILLSLLTSCSEEPNNSEEQPSEGTPTVYNVVGVWEDVSGNFISIDKSGFICFCMVNIENPTIQSGSYQQEQGTGRLLVVNPYFNTNSEIRISKFSDSEMEVSIQYYTLRDEIRYTGGPFKKTNKIPAEKDNPLIGRSYTTPVSSGQTGGFLWNKTTEFLTYNSGRMTADQGNAKKYPKSFYYFYFDGKIYYQEFANAPTIGAWTSYTNTGDIFCASVNIQPNGSISIGSTDRLTK